MLLIVHAALLSSKSSGNESWALVSCKTPHNEVIELEVKHRICAIDKQAGVNIHRRMEDFW